jgi:hypothetical protein
MNETKERGNLVSGTPAWPERKQYADDKANERIKERINEYRQQAGDW